MRSTGEIQPREGGALINVNDVVVPARERDIEVAIPWTPTQSYEGSRGDDFESGDEAALMDPIKAQLAEADRAYSAGPRSRFTADDLDAERRAGRIAPPSNAILHPAWPTVWTVDAAIEREHAR